MFEATSIASTTTALAALARKLIPQVATFLSAFPDGAEDSCRVSEELFSVCQILQQLETVLGGNICSSLPFPAEVINDLRAVLNRCVEIFEQFQAFMDGFNGGSWRQAEERITGFRNELSAHKVTLSITLQLGTLLTAQKADTTSGSTPHPQTATKRKSLDTELRKIKTLCQRFISRIGPEGAGADLPTSSDSTEVLLTYMSHASTYTDLILETTPPPSPPPSPKSATSTTPLPTPPLNGDLFSAASSGDVDLLRDLLAAGASPNARSDAWPSPTALQAAATENHREAVQILLEYGADVHARDANNVDPLQAAARYWSYACVVVLLEAGADVNAKGGLYGTALEAAEAGQCLVLKKLLLEKGAKCRRWSRGRFIMG